MDKKQSIQIRTPLLYKEGDMIRSRSWIRTLPPVLELEIIPQAFEAKLNSIASIYTCVTQQLVIQTLRNMQNNFVTSRINTSGTVIISPGSQFLVYNVEKRGFVKKFPYVIPDSRLTPDHYDAEEMYVEVTFYLYHAFFNGQKICFIDFYDQNDFSVIQKG